MIRCTLSAPLGPLPAGAVLSIDLPATPEAHQAAIARQLCGGSLTPHAITRGDGTLVAAYACTCFGILVKPGDIVARIVADDDVDDPAALADAIRTGAAHTALLSAGAAPATPRAPRQPRAARAAAATPPPAALPATPSAAAAPPLADA